MIWVTIQKEENRLI